MVYLKNKIRFILIDILNNLKGYNITLEILGRILKQQFSLKYDRIIIKNRTVSLNTYIKRHYGSFKNFIKLNTNYKIYNNIIYIN